MVKEIKPEIEPTVTFTFKVKTLWTVARYTGTLLLGYMLGYLMVWYSVGH